MEIIKDIEIKNKAIWLRKERVLVIGDLHLGYEESLSEKGTAVPRETFKEMLSEIRDLLKLKPKEVIILGDLKHEFGKILKQEWNDVLELTRLIKKSSALVVLKGNHDKIIGPILEKEKIPLVDEYFMGGVCFLHGNKIPESKKFKKSKIILIGHEHPAIELSDGVKKEKYKCFLLGKYRAKKLIVLPSFFSILGADILREKFLSPFLQQSVDNFAVFVVQDKKSYDFGKIKKIRKAIN